MVRKKFKRGAYARYRRRMNKESLEEVQMKTLALISCVGLLIFGFRLSYNWSSIVKNPRPLLGIIFGLAALIYVVRRWKKKRKETYYAQRKTLGELRTMDPFEFEKLVAIQLKKQGYIGVKVTQARQDGGYDLAASAGGKKYIIQCKRYSATNKVPVAEIRAISGVAKQLGKNCIGMMLTTGPLTKAAHKEAKDYGVVVWDEECVVEKLGIV